MDITRRYLQFMIYKLSGADDEPTGTGLRIAGPKKLVFELDSRLPEFEGDQELLAMLMAIGEEIDAEPNYGRAWDFVEDISRTRIFSEMQKLIVPPRVAVIKKRESMIRIPKLLLEESGFEVDCWHNIEDFVESRTWPDCIASGWFFDHKANASFLLSNTERIPVVIISGLEEFESKALELGAFEFQRGTYGNRNFLNAVRRAINTPLFFRKPAPRKRCQEKGVRYHFGELGKFSWF